jgi:hypothetical protein
MEWMNEWTRREEGEERRLVVVWVGKELVELTGRRRDSRDFHFHPLD